jgi:hypothetical protein
VAQKREYKFEIDAETGLITTEVLGIKGAKCTEAVEEIQAAIGGAVLETTKTSDYWKKPDPDPNFQFNK